MRGRCRGVVLDVECRGSIHRFLQSTAVPMASATQVRDSRWTVVNTCGLARLPGCWQLVHWRRPVPSLPTPFEAEQGAAFPSQYDGRHSDGRSISSQFSSTQPRRLKPEGCSDGQIVLADLAARESAHDPPWHHDLFSSQTQATLACVLLRKASSSFGSRTWSSQAIPHQ